VGRGEGGTGGRGTETKEGETEDETGREIERDR